MLVRSRWEQEKTWIPFFEGRRTCAFLADAQAFAFPCRFGVFQDFQGGNIVGAVNVPSETFYVDSNVDLLVEEFRSYERVVFHCMFSQQRVRLVPLGRIRRSCYERFASYVPEGNEEASAFG